MKVKITLNGPGGELDSSVIDAADDQDDEAIGAAVRELVDQQVWHVGDSLTVESLEDD